MAGKTALKQAMDSMQFHWCPVTGNLPTRITRAGFEAACAGFQAKADKKHGQAKFREMKYKWCRRCAGKILPPGLEFIELAQYQPKEAIMAMQWQEGKCTVCGRAKKVRKVNGYVACSICEHMIRGAKLYPEYMIGVISDLHGNEYFPRSVPDDSGLAKILAEIKDAANIDAQAMVRDLPAIIRDKCARAEDLRKRNQRQAATIESLTAEIADLKDRQPLPEPAPAGGTGSSIAAVCADLQRMLLEKNRAYGDSALNPVRVFSSAGPEEQLLVRIDDKLSRLARGSEYPGDDTIRDLAGYLVLLLVQRSAGKKEQAERGEI